MSYKKYIRFIFLILIFTLFSENFLSAQVNYQIQKIKFEGNKTFKKNVLMEQISIEESNFIKRVIQRKEPSFYNETLVKSDVERLIRFYQANGFLYVNVKLAPLEIDEKNHRVNLKFLVDENEAIKVDSINFTIVDPTTIKKDSVLKRLNRKKILKENERYTDEKVLLEINRANRAFRTAGYAYASTNYNLSLKPEQNKTDVEYDIISGPKSYFGTINIAGNSFVRTKFIRDQLTFKEGDVYSEKKIDESRRILYDLQVFRIVSITLQKNENTKDPVIPVTVTVTEQPRFSTEVGIGYGTEEQFRTYTRSTYRSFFGDSRRITLDAKHSAIEPYYLSLSFIEPRFLDKKLSLTVNPYFRRRIEPAFDTRTLGLLVPLNYKWNEILNTTVSYYFERVKQNLQDGFTDVPNPEDRKFLYNKSGVIGSLIYNNAFPKFDPKRGYYASTGAKYNFGGAFHYMKYWIDGRKYTNLGKEYVLAMRGMIGAITSFDAVSFIPVEDRYYAGGSNSIRGWGRSMLGPMWENGKPKGGKSILEANVEVRHPFIWKLDYAVFFDAGNVWENSFQYDLSNLGYAVGAGLRFATPIGPVRLDIGFPLQGNSRRPQFFINVGQAF